VYIFFSPTKSERTIRMNVHKKNNMNDMCIIQFIFSLFIFAAAYYGYSYFSLFNFSEHASTEASFWKFNTKAAYKGGKLKIIKLEKA
jgi:hypothetical protein